MGLDEDIDNKRRKLFGTDNGTNIGCMRTAVCLYKPTDTDTVTVIGSLVSGALSLSPY